MNLNEILESMMESVDGEGNKHWKRDLLVCGSLLLGLGAFVLYCCIIMT